MTPFTMPNLVYECVAECCVNIFFGEINYAVEGIQVLFWYRDTLWIWKQAHTIESRPIQILIFQEISMAQILTYCLKKKIKTSAHSYTKFCLSQRLFIHQEVNFPLVAHPCKGFCTKYSPLSPGINALIALIANKVTYLIVFNVWKRQWQQNNHQ